MWESLDKSSQIPLKSNRKKNEGHLSQAAFTLTIINDFDFLFVDSVIRFSQKPNDEGFQDLRYKFRIQG